MEVVSYLRRSSEGERYTHPLVEVSKVNHRPRKHFRLRIENPSDVLAARAQKLAIFLLDSSDMRILSYPMTIPDTIVIPREFVALMASDLRTVVFQSLEACQRPRIEDFVMVLLHVDPLAARAVLDRNLDLIDLEHLTRRVYQEQLEQEATRVWFQDHITIPVVGEQLDHRALTRALAKNRVTGIVP